MINKQKVLGIIPARGGSKGLPRKNILPFANKPLIVHSINQANKSKYIDKLILSSEDQKIIDICKSYKIDIPFIRPKSLSQDETSGLDVVFHAVENMQGYDIVVLLQPTSPLRTFKDIDKCIEKLINRDVNACVSVVETSKSPYWMFELNEHENFIPVVKNTPLVSIRQNLPRTFGINGAVYVAKIDWYKKTKEFINEETIAYIMPKDRSIDIDTKEDFLFAEYLIEKK